MRKPAILIAAFVVLIPAFAYSNTLSLKGGYFFPRAQGGPDSLWNIEVQQMSFKKADFRGSILGFSFEYFVAKELSMTLSLDTFSKRKAGYYLDYVGYTFDEGDFAFPASEYIGNFDITHSFNISILPIELSLKLMPLGRRIKLIPYVGGGISMFVWSAGIRGQMIDFTDEWIYDDPELGEVTIYKVNLADAREKSRINFACHAFGGLMFPIGNRITLEAEFRYRAGTGRFKDTFLDFEEFDLSGYSLTAGLNYWF